jgi:hypothetical protein
VHEGSQREHGSHDLREGKQGVRKRGG